MLNNTHDIITLLPREGFILTACGAMTAWLTREKLLEVVGKCQNHRMKDGVLLMDYEQGFVIKVSLSR